MSKKTKQGCTCWPTLLFAPSAAFITFFANSCSVDKKIETFFLILCYSLDTVHVIQYKPMEAESIRQYDVLSSSLEVFSSTLLLTPSLKSPFNLLLLWQDWSVRQIYFTRELICSKPASVCISSQLFLLVTTQTEMIARFINRSLTDSIALL